MVTLRHAQMMSIYGGGRKDYLSDATLFGLLLIQCELVFFGHDFVGADVVASCNNF